MSQCEVSEVRAWASEKDVCDGGGGATSDGGQSRQDEDAVSPWRGNVIWEPNTVRRASGMSIAQCGLSGPYDK